MVNLAVHLKDSWASADAAETTAFLARIAAIPYTLDATHIAAYSALINGLVADGVWVDLDALYIFATQAASVAPLNLVQTAFPISVVGSPTFSADHGWSMATFDGMPTGFTPSVQQPLGSKYQQNSAHISAWSNATGNPGPPGTGDGAAAGTVGSNSVAWVEVSVFTSASVNAYRVNTMTNQLPVGDTSNGKGFYINSRTASATTKNYWGLGGTLADNGVDTHTSTGLPDGPIRVCGLAGYTYCSKEISAVSFGGGLTDTDALNFYNRIQAYMTAVGN